MAALCCVLLPPQGKHEIARVQIELPPVKHEINVSLKLVHVYVSDKKKSPILDLEKKDFVVFDNGKKCSLTEFERHILSPSCSSGEAGDFPDSHGAEPGSPQLLMPRKFLFLFDFAYNNSIGIEKSKRAALDFIIEGLNINDEVGVFSYSAMKGLVLHEYLTKDHDHIRRVVGEFGIHNIAGRAEDFEARYWDLLTAESDQNPSLKQVVAFRKESELQAYNYVRKMSELDKALRYVPGKKHIILFSSGVPYSLVTGIRPPTRISQKFETWGESPLALRYEDLLKELAAANCDIYAFDTQELGTSLDWRTRGTFSLQKMTSATGGKYFGNLNSYEKHIEKIQDLTGCYYVLGYYVDDTWDGAYHKIKVEVSRPGLEVHAQKGYFNPKPFGEYNDLERMLHLVDLALSEEPLFQTPVRFPLEVVPCPDGSKGNLCLAAKIAVEKIREVLAGKSEFVAVIFDDKENIVSLNRNEKTTYTLTGELFTFGAAFSLSPGKYQCRLVIRNLETGRGAVASATAVI